MPSTSKKPAELPTKALGHMSDMAKDQLAGKVIDTNAGVVFENRDDYREAYGGKPERLGKHYHLVQEKALERGAARASS